MWSFIFSSFSAFLLIIAYPQIEWWPLAWIALVPLLFVLNTKRPWAAFRGAYLCGFLFFAGTLGWFVYVTYAGAFLLIAYLALYFAFFGLAFVYFQRLPLIARIFVLSAVWAALEFIRSHAATGFGWVTLGHSQYKNLLLIQIADITGVYGVSFLVVLVNLLVFESLRGANQIRRAQAVVAVILSAALAYGVIVATGGRHHPTVKVGVVQPNIPQSIKWNERRQPIIVQKTIQWTKTLRDQKPEIIIWPETSLPGIIGEVPQLLGQIQEAAAGMRIPILIGVIAQEGGAYYNSALLISADGKIEGRYDKMHLVPFGEYLPFRPLLGGIIDKIIPLEDFTSGRTYTIFPAGCPQTTFGSPRYEGTTFGSPRYEGKRFGALICFEDTVSGLRRNFVKAGAQFLVNMTNDAWFKDTKAPFLHLQAAVFGCVENKRALVRAANTGVSAFVDPYGRIITAVHDDNGKKTFITGVAAAVIPLVSEQTFYTKYGDVFTCLCFACILGGILVSITKIPFGGC